MPSLLGLLHMGATSLSTSQAGVAVHGNNVANARTPGYARRGLLIDEGRGPLTGGGAVARGVTRSEDFVLSQKIAHQQGQLLGRNLLASGLREIETVLQAGQSSLSQKVAELGTAFSELAASPQDVARRTDAIEKGRAVALEFNRVGHSLGRLQAQGRESAQALLPQINDLARQIAELNRSLAAGAPTPETAALARGVDQREEAVRTLSGLVGGELLRNADGTVDVLVGGLSLVHGAVASELTLSPQGGSLAVLVGGAPVQVAVSGSLGGQLLVQDTAGQTLAQFDRLAYDLSAALNAQHAFGVGLDGVGARPFFTPLGAVPGAALSLTLDPAITPQTLAVGFTGKPGDNRNALALANLIDQPVLEGGRSTFRNVYARISSQLGGDVQRADGEASIAQGVADALQQARDALAGVQTDEELTQLQAYQRGFEASSRFIQVVNDMLDRLVSM